MKACCYYPADAYERVYGNLTEVKAASVRQICDLFSLASECYFLTARSGGGDSSDANVVCGALAEMFLVKFDYLMRLIGKPYQEMLATVDATSKWLEERHWISLPAFTDRNGATVTKTTAGMHADMVRYRDQVREFRRSIRERKEQCRKS